MKKYTHLIAASLMLGALSPLQTRAAVNTWSNAAGDLTWLDSSTSTTISTNWTSPVYWNDGDDAIFGATGVGTVNLGSYVGASSLTFNADGYSIFGSGYTLTLSNAASVTVNSSATIQANIVGTNGLVIFGTTNLTLMGDGNLTVGNQFTGGTFVHGGNVIMAAPGVSSGGSSYALDAINALDTGATVKYGVTYAGYDPSVDESATRVNVANAQMRVQSGYLYLTGGTLDLYGIGDGHEVPPPSGSGLIINSSPFNRAILRINNVTNGMVTEFDGQIADGGPAWTRSSDGPAYQMNLDEHSGNAATIILGGSNSYSGFTRWGNNSTIILTGAGTLGYPSPTNPPSRQVIMNGGKLDLNGTSQKTGVFWTKGDGDGCHVTNSAVGTLSILTLCFNDDIHTTAPGNGGANGGITCSLQDTPGTSGLLGITKMGAGLQVIGGVSGNNSVNGTPVNNYHGDTTVNNGTLEIINIEAVSPNSSFRLNSPGVLKLDFAGTATIGQLYLNGVRQPAGIYGSGQTSLITGSGSLQVLPPNVWTDGSANFQWDLLSANWTNPTLWSQGSDAIFNSTGAGIISLADNITAENLTFNANNYEIDGGGSKLTLIDAATITSPANGSNILAVTLAGTNGLTFAGTGTTYLTGANSYKGGARIHSGTVICLATSAGTGSSSPYAIDSVEALDTGATLVLPGISQGSLTLPYNSDRDQIGWHGQLPVGQSHMHMTGGTLDFFNDPKQQRIPILDGSGLVINSGGQEQAEVAMANDGLDHTFSGVIADGNNGVLYGDNVHGDTKGPGYQIGIVTFSDSIPGKPTPARGFNWWTLTGHNTYSGSTRIDNGAAIKLVGNGSLGNPTAALGLTGPMRIYGPGGLELNGHNTTIANMTDGSSSGWISNSAPNTVSVFTFGYGNEFSYGRACSYQFGDSPSTGAILSLKKVSTGQPYIVPNSWVNSTNESTIIYATNSWQTLKSSATCTYSGDTTVAGGVLVLQGPSAVSPNSAYRLQSAPSPGCISSSCGVILQYTGTANVRQLWIDGVQQPNGVYGAIGNGLGATGVAGILPASTGTLTVTGYAPVVLNTTKTGGNLNFTWSGVYKLQSNTNLVGGTWTDIPGTSPLSIPVDTTKKALFFRLTTY